MLKQEQAEPRRNKPYETEAAREAAVKESKARWLAANAEQRKATQADWKARNKDKVAGYHLKREYGLSLEGYNTLYHACGGKCEICTAEIAHILSTAKVGDKACVDHCHTTGVVRGMLCHMCNRHLSLIDNHLIGVNNYLRKAGATEVHNTQAKKAP